MAFASKVGRARVSSRNPQALAVCQRCGIWYNRVDLRDQFDWRGAQLQNLYLLVCPHCYDEPQQQLRQIVLPADPVPVYRPNVENFDNAEVDYRSVAFAPVTDPITGIPIPSDNLRVTQDCSNRTMLPYGAPTGLDANATMPLSLVNGVPAAFGVALPILSVFANGCTVAMTCSAPHGLQPNAQVSVTGLQGGANGFFSVSVPTATQFTYQTTEPANVALTSTTRVATTLVGLPNEATSFPLTYGGGAAIVPHSQPITVPGPPTNVMAS